MNCYIVKFTGPFGFIKPWTAVRDSETFSQQFLTPSIVGGIERKLFPELLQQPFELSRIIGHRLSYSQMDSQQERIQSRGWNSKKVEGKPAFLREQSILSRYVLIDPVLLLAFTELPDARRAAQQHICLCRNEDLLFPSGEIMEASIEDWQQDEDRFPGFELVFEQTERSFLVGYNRFENGAPMYGRLNILGNPVNNVR